MDSRLREMLDHYEITKVLKAYCHGCDRCDFVQMSSVYAKDSWDDHGRTKGPGTDYARHATNGMRDTNMVCHILGQTMTDVRGDEAGAETYFIEVLHQIGGRYVDLLVRENGDWKIKKRQVVREWSISWPITHDWQAGVRYVEAHRSNQDPACAVLNMPHSGVPPFAAESL
jgi:hypothetical protein